MFNGDVNLSVTMTLISSVASFGMTSLWAWVLGQHLVEGEGAKEPGKPIQIPYGNLALALLAFALPLCLGAIFKYKWTEFGHRIYSLVAKPFFLLCLILLALLGIYNSISLFYLLHWRHILSGLMMGCCGHVFGAFSAFLCKQKQPQIIAICLETALQNFSISFVVLYLTFESPYSDLGVLPIIGYYLCSTTPALFVVYCFFMLYRFSTGQKTFEEIRKNSNETTEKVPLDLKTDK